MKRFLITTLLLLLSLGAWAQYAGTGVLKRSGTHLKMDGVKLSAAEQTALLSDIAGTDCNPAWDKARSGRNTGIGLTVGGGVAVLGGCATVLLGATASAVGAVIGAAAGSIGGQETAQQAAQQGATAGEPYITGGLIAAGAGVVALGVGVPMIVVNAKRLNGIVNTYNEPKAQLTLGPTGNGIGLSIRF